MADRTEPKAPSEREAVGLAGELEALKAEADELGWPGGSYWHAKLSRLVLDNWAAILSALQREAPAELKEVVNLEAKLRNVIAHATGGATSDTSLSLNDICVRITRHRNLIWQEAMERGVASQAAELALLKQQIGEAVEAIDRHVAHGKMGDWSIALDEIRKIARALGESGR